MTNQEKATKIAQDLVSIIPSLRYNRPLVRSCIKDTLDKIEAESESQTGQGSTWQQKEPGMDY